MPWQMKSIFIMNMKLLPYAELCRKMPSYCNFSRLGRFLRIFHNSAQHGITQPPLVVKTVVKRAIRTTVKCPHRGSHARGGGPWLPAKKAGPAEIQSARPRRHHSMMYASTISPMYMTWASLLAPVFSLPISWG